MISHGKDIKVFTGNSNPALAKEICQIIGTKLGESEVKTFADGEVSVSLYETVRGSDVFLINSTCKPVNDSLMELLIMIDACRRLEKEMKEASKMLEFEYAALLRDQIIALRGEK